RKMGIGDPEFVNPNLNGAGLPQSTGRVQFYQASSGAVNGLEGARISGATPADNTLWGSQTTLNAYDAILFPCTGGHDDKTTQAKNRVRAYADAGGRVFTTHYSYVWTYDNQPWGCGDTCATAGQTVAAWDPD